MSGIAIRAEGLWKQYRLGGAQQRYKTLRDSIAQTFMRPFRRGRKSAGNGGPPLFWALKDVSFEIKAGEVVGVIGRNGAGKSTLLKILSRITEPTRGFAEIHGRVGSLLEVGTGFHPELSGRENIYLNGAILGMKRTEVARKFDEIVAFAEVEKFVDTPVKFYSSGMYLRLAFAVAAHLEPEILLVDEVLAVGDRKFQEKCLGKMGEVAGQGRTVLLVSHNMAAVAAICTQGLLLDEGALARSGTAHDCVSAYQFGIQPADAFTNGTAASAMKPKEIQLIAPQSGQWDVATAQTFEFAACLPDGVTSAHLKFSVATGSGLEVLHLRSSQTLQDGTGSRIYRFSLTVPPLWLGPGAYAVKLRIVPYGIGQMRPFESDPFVVEAHGADQFAGAADAVLAPPAEWAVEVIPR
jgi:lipopolysaccharide transport system ATP-binding protein